jgi:aminoglycoside phosphotransferase (APT) family kinase protein
MKTLSPDERARLARAESVLRRARGGWWSVESVRRSPDPGRWVCVLASDDGARVVAKFAPDDRGARAERLLHELHARGADAHTLRVPVPLAHDAPSRALLLPHVPGVPLDAAPVPDDAALAAAGRALAELHALPIEHAHVRPRRLADHVADLVRPAPSVVMRARPETRAVLNDVMEMLEAARASCDAAPHTIIHRDYHLRQLFAEGHTLWVVDWDDAAVGDPAFDVAYVLTYLRTHLPAPAAERAVERVRDGYASVAGQDALDGMNGRLPVYERFNLLRRACRRFRLRDPGWEAELTRMIDWLTASATR